MDDATIRELERAADAGDDASIERLETALAREGREVPWHVTLRRLASRARVTLCWLAQVAREAEENPAAFFIGNVEQDGRRFVVAAAKGSVPERARLLTIGVAVVRASERAHIQRDLWRHVELAWPSLRSAFVGGRQMRRRFAERWADRTRSARVVRVEADEALAWFERMGAKAS